MAPPERLFPVGDLEQRIHTHSVNLKDKNRKLGQNFNLKDCELYELVQYSCTTNEAQRELALKLPGERIPLECFPFVRLFRKCGQGDKTFHVETTAWEGQHAWPKNTKQEPEQIIDNSNAFATYGNYFWSSK